MFSPISKNLKLFSFLLFLSSVFLLLSFIPNMYELSQKDKVPFDRTMIAGEHIYTYDYNVYLSKIRQGMEGRLMVVDKYDNNPQDKGVFLQMLYLSSGWVGRLFTDSPAMVFHTLRVVLSILWMGTIVYLCIFFMQPYIHKTRYKIPIILAFLFCMLSASFPYLYEMEGTTWVGAYMQWWQEMDIVKRISYIPHYTAGYILLSFMTVLMVVYTNTKQKKYFFLLSILLFLSFFIHPSGGLLFLMSFILYRAIVILQLKTFDKKTLLLATLQSLALFSIALVPLAYIKMATSAYPWKSLVDFDKTNPLPLNVKDYILALGPLFFSGVAGAILAIIKKKYVLIALATWVFSAFAGFFLFSIVTIQSPARFMQTANHIPLAILSVFLIQEITTKYRHYVFTLISSFFIVFVIFLGVVQFYFSIKAQNLFNFQKAQASQPLVAYPSQVTHPLTDVYNAYLWLDKHTKNDEVVLSKITAGNFIPAYSGNFVYIGHNPETPDFAQREAKVKQFFSLTQEEKEMRAFLQKERISYIFYGPQEKEESPN